MARGSGNGRGDRGRPYRGGKFRGGRGRGRGGQAGFSIADEDLDFTVRMYADAPPARGTVTPRGGRGRGRGGQFSGPNSGANTPNRRGFGSPRGVRGRGHDGIGASPRGRGAGPFRTSTTLSGLLYQERPLLRPIIFVPSVLTKVLFQEEEELLKPGVEDVDDTEQSHVPTADRVSRVFSGLNNPLAASDEEDEEEREEIEEIDFNEVGNLFDATTISKTTTIRKSKLVETTAIITEQQFTGFYIDKNPQASTDIDGLAKMVEDTLSTTDEVENPAESNLFYVDTQPSTVPAEMAPPPGAQPSILQADDDDDIIVYVAPHPRNTSSMEEQQHAGPSEHPEPSLDGSRFSPYVRAAPLPTQPVASSSQTSASVPITEVEPPSFASVSFSFASNPAATSGKNTPSRLRVPPVSTPRQAKAWKRKRGPRRARKPSSFGAFGALREEALWRQQDSRKSERRQNASDLEWGDTDDEDAKEIEEEVDPQMKRLLNMLDKGKGKAEEDDDGHGMDVDEELDLSAMKSFVGGLLGSGSGTHMTMDDLRDAAVMRMEDEEAARSQTESSDDEQESVDEEVEDVLAVEEAILVSESPEVKDGDGLEEGEMEDDEDEEDEDEDEDEDADAGQTPRSSFEARLERLRAKARSRKPEDASFDNYMDDSDEDEDDLLTRNMTWAEKDEDYLQHMHDILDENEDILSGRERKQRNKLFRSIRDGDFDMPLEGASPARRKKDKFKDLPPELQGQWETDRKKKAQYKKARELARLKAASDPLAKKKGGKKGRKAMLLAASLDRTISVLPNRVIDMVSLVQQIRRFIADVGGPSTMSLPPTNKETRKNMHEMAAAFNLKSISKGDGDTRYTTLTKTTRSGVGINEAKVAKIMRRSGGMGALGDSFIYDKKGKGASRPIPRHKEGDEVGRAAPKINESNVGFKMLAMMGWTEGDRIGSSMKGLEAPITAIIKTTKLGLGATK